MWRAALVMGLLLADVTVQGLFLGPDEARSFLGRGRRANDKGYLKLEERRQGDLERECVEETCSREEAREVFENEPETEYFYPRYQDCIRRFGPPATVEDDARRSFKGCVRGLPDQCSPVPCKVGSYAQCVDLQGDFQCVCLPGWMGKTCSEVWSECAERGCEQGCSSSRGAGGGASGSVGGASGGASGGVQCHCDGRNGSRLAHDGRTCQPIQTCSPVNDLKDPGYFYLGASFNGGPALFMRFKLQKLTRPMSVFELRTFDPEGLVFYGETGDHHNWFLLALNNGQLEVQMKDDNGRLVTTGGKRVNNGLWHQVSVEKTLSHVIVKLDNEEVINVNNPGHISSGTAPGSELAISVAGLPPTAPDMLRPMNVRLDGCIRNWNWMGQDTAWIASVTRADPSKQCYSHVEPGSYFPGTGFVRFSSFSYGASREAGALEWDVQVQLEFRASSELGVILALVRPNGTEAELTLALGGGAAEGVSVYIGGELLLSQAFPAAPHGPPAGPRPRGRGSCDGAWHSLGLGLSAGAGARLELDGAAAASDGWTGGSARGLSRLAGLLAGPVHTYLGGIPDAVPATSAPVSAPYRGCVRGVRVGGRVVDLHDGDATQGAVRPHSCLALA